MGLFHDKTFPGESSAYREARNRLLKEELDLRDWIEAVAALRRKLPPGGHLKQDYTFEEIDGSGVVKPIAFSGLFAAGKDSLIIYNFMYAADWEKPCPMCTSILDAFNGNAAYVNDRAGLVVVAKAPIRKLKACGDDRGWDLLRLLSSEKNSFNTDYNAEFPSRYGVHHPVLHCFVRRDGAIYHSWSSELLYVKSEGQPRHVDLMWPLWNLLDLTPEGRGTDWYPQYQK